jgi:hypothetical protein
VNEEPGDVLLLLLGWTPVVHVLQHASTCIEKKYLLLPSVTFNIKNDHE